MPWRGVDAASSWRSPLGCALSSSYGFLSGAWPFGVVEGIWTFVALRRWQQAGRGAGRRPA